MERSPSCALTIGFDLRQQAELRIDDDDSRQVKTFAPVTREDFSQRAAVFTWKGRSGNIAKTVVVAATCWRDQAQAVSTAPGSRPRCIDLRGPRRLGWRRLRGILELLRSRAVASWIVASWMLRGELRASTAPTATTAVTRERAAVRSTAFVAFLTREGRATRLPTPLCCKPAA